jgi:4-hydroxy-4-methyl-2-oxoglutarate aldolase
MNGPDCFQQALRFGSATLHEAFDRQGDLPPSIRATARRVPLSGPALTVSTLPGNNLLIHRAVAQAQPGDVLVVAMTVLTEGCHDFGYWGDILTAAAIEKGIAGLVLDGCVRDIEAIESLAFPVFARGTAIRGTTKVPEGEVGGTVRIGHVEIARGDLIVGDADGVMVVPAASIEATLEKAGQRVNKERSIAEQLTRVYTTLELDGLI